MPKINVYLPDELAGAVRAAGVPVSAVCQKALSEAVRTIGRARRAVAVIRDPGFDPSRAPQIEERLASLMTPRLVAAIALARRAAGPANITTSHLLLGMLEEAENLGVRVLQSLDVDRDELAIEARAADDAERDPGVGGSPPRDGLGERFSFVALSRPAVDAIAATLETAIEFGHNYVGCEHLLLGLLAVPEGGAFRVLTEVGIDGAGARRAVTSAIAGFAHARAVAAPTSTQLDDITRRLVALEQRLAPGDS